MREQHVHFVSAPGETSIFIGNMGSDVKDLSLVGSVTGTIEERMLLLEALVVGLHIASAHITTEVIA